MVKVLVEQFGILSAEVGALQFTHQIFGLAVTIQAVEGLALLLATVDETARQGQESCDILLFQFLALAQHHIALVQLLDRVAQLGIDLAQLLVDGLFLFIEPTVALQQLIDGNDSAHEQQGDDRDDAKQPHHVAVVALLLGLVGIQDFRHDARRLDIAQARTIEIGIVDRHAHVAVGAVDVALVKQDVGNRTQ